MNLKGLNVTVVGISKSGTSAALLLRRAGAQVSATDNGANEDIEHNRAQLTAEGIPCEIGTHSESFLKGRDLVVVSPGVSSEAVIIKWAEAARIPIISELELGYLFCKGRITAITGTNGKTTTTTLVGEIIKASGRPTSVCGNIGTPLCSEIPHITGEHEVVLEVSTFQLERINRFKPYLAVILNVTDDHLDRHRSFDEYLALKKKICLNQTGDDFAITNYDDPRLAAPDSSRASRTLFFSRRAPVEGAFLHGDDIVVKIGSEARRLASRDIIPMAGVHNLENVLASVVAGTVLGISNADIINAITRFRPLPHRFQLVAEIEGVAFVNDSKATNVDSTLKALESADRPVILIAGGRDKMSDFSVARDLIAEKVRMVIVIGEAADSIAAAVGSAVPVERSSSLPGAVVAAHQAAVRGDVVLLSPMCASFDMFKNYVERGETFVKAVNRLKRSQTTTEVT